MGEWLEVGPTGNRAYLAVPERGTGARVLVLHAWWGLTSVFTDACDRLALEAKIRAAGREVTLHVYPDTGHWFVEPNQPNPYNAAATELARERTLAFLKGRLGGHRMDLLDRLLEHDRWATARLLDLSRGLTDAQLDQPFDVGHRTLRATFEHATFNVAFWTAVATGQAADAQRDDRSLAALVDRHERAYAAFAAFARRVRDEQRLDDTFVDHFGGPMTFGGAILHVVLHDAEHRSEALHILERLGVPDLPEVDHGLWDFKRRGF